MRPPGVLLTVDQDSDPSTYTKVAEGKTRHDLGRDPFIERVWDWKRESGDTISRQIRRMGSSLDWSRDRFTMDDGYAAAVRVALEVCEKTAALLRAQLTDSQGDRDDTALPQQPAKRRRTVERGDDDGVAASSSPRAAANTSSVGTLAIVHAR